MGVGSFENTSAFSSYSFSLKYFAPGAVRVSCERGLSGGINWMFWAFEEASFVSFDGPIVDGFLENCGLRRRMTARMPAMAMMTSRMTDSRDRLPNLYIYLWYQTSMTVSRWAQELFNSTQMPKMRFETPLVRGHMRTFFGWRWVSRTR